MKNPFLIQRAKFENDNSCKGIDSIINLDYMGSAEFEFGVLPKSLKEIRANESDYVYLDIPFGDKVFTMFCKASEKSDAKECLQGLIDSRFFLKEYSNINTWVKPSENDRDWQKKHPHNTDFWWDIDNNIMFWKKNPEFEAKFKKIISVKPE